MDGRLQGSSEDDVMIWLEIRDPNFFKKRSRKTAKGAVRKVSVDLPCPTIMAAGIRSASAAFLVSDRGLIPTMIEEESSERCAG